METFNDFTRNREGSVILSSPLRRAPTVWRTVLRFLYIMHRLGVTLEFRPTFSFRPPKEETFFIRGIIGQPWNPGFRREVSFGNGWMDVGVHRIPVGKRFARSGKYTPKKILELIQQTLTPGSNPGKR